MPALSTHFSHAAVCEHVKTSYPVQFATLSATLHLFLSEVWRPNPRKWKYEKSTDAEISIEISETNFHLSTSCVSRSHNLRDSEVVTLGWNHEGQGSTFVKTDTSWILWILCVVFISFLAIVYFDITFYTDFAGEFLFTKRCQVTALRGSPAAPSASVWRIPGASVSSVSVEDSKEGYKNNSKMRHFLRNLCWVTMGFQDRGSSKFKTSGGRSCSIQWHNLYFPILRLTLNWTHSRFMIYPKLAAQQRKVWWLAWKKCWSVHQRRYPVVGYSANQMIKLAETFCWGPTVLRL